MGLLTGMSRKEAQSFADFMARDRPFKGTNIRIFKGRKHKGKEGVVFWHGEDRYAKSWGDSNQQMARHIMGRFGFRVGVETEDGEKFFAPAEYTMIIRPIAEDEKEAYRIDYNRTELVAWAEYWDRYHNRKGG